MDRETRRNLWLAGVSVVVVLTLFEGTASLLMAVKDAIGVSGIHEASHSQYDPDLGWSNQPGYSNPDLYGPGRSYSVNDQGLRGSRHYERSVPSGTTRVIALGDSFTMAFGVSAADTYPAQMERLGNQVQTLNMGMGGYGIDQAILWYQRDGSAFEADHLVFAFISDDFRRMRSPSFDGYPKPVFRLDGENLVAENHPVPRRWGWRNPLERAIAFVGGTGVGRMAAYLLLPAPQAPYVPIDADLELVADAAFRLLVDLAGQNEHELTLVYLPTPDLLLAGATEEARFASEFAERNGVRSVDMTGPVLTYVRETGSDIYRPDLHFTEEGNRLVAREVLRALGIVQADP